MRKTKKFALTLSLLSAAIASIAAANLDLTSASADTVNTGDGIFMNYGASVRYNAESEQDNGIRYELRLTTAAYDGLKENGTATFGILIAPAAYEVEKPLNEANVFGESAVYNWAEWNDEQNGYVYTEEEGKTRIVNVSATVDFTTTNLNTKTVDGTEYYYYYGALTGILEENIAREFVGVGYVSAGESYTFATRNDNVRSIAYVAQKSVLNDTTALGESEKEQAAAKAWLQENYVDKVKEVETTYSVELRLATNIGGGYTVLDLGDLSYKTTIDAEIELTEETGLVSMEGLIGTPATSNDAKALANNRSKLVINYTYANDITVKLQGNSSEYYSFKSHALYFLTDDNKTDFTGNENGIFFNSTAEDRTISVSGSAGAAAIVDSHGVVIEGRDGANGKLVNAENPVRTTAPQDSLTSTAFAKNLKIPSGGYAIVLQYANNENTPTDVSCATAVTNKTLRDFMYKSIISNYGNCVQIKVEKTENADELVMTDYEARLTLSAPTVKVDAVYNGTLADDALTSGVTATLLSSFDGEGETVTPTVTVMDKSAVNLKKAGNYAVTLTATHGELTQDFGRAVTVNDKITVTIGESTFTIETANTATTTAEFEVDEATLSNDQTDFYAPAFRLFTPSWTGGNIDANGKYNYSAALILDSTGKVVIAYGATGTAYAAEGNTASSVTSGSVKEYFNVWSKLIENGETYYLLIAPNDNNATDGNNSNGGSRYFLWFLMPEKTEGAVIVGQQVTISYFNFN